MLLLYAMYMHLLKLFIYTVVYTVVYNHLYGRAYGTRLDFEGSKVGYTPYGMAYGTKWVKYSFFGWFVRVHIRYGIRYKKNKSQIQYITYCMTDIIPSCPIPYCNYFRLCRIVLRYRIISDLNIILLKAFRLYL